MVIYRIDRPTAVEDTSVASVIQTDTVANNVRKTQIEDRLCYFTLVGKNIQLHNL